MVAWRWLGLWAGVSIAAHAAPARGAEPPAPPVAPPPPPAAPVVPVTFRTTDEGAALSVRGGGLSTQAGWCPTTCTLNIPRGNYLVFASSGGRKSGTLSVDVHGPSEVVVSPGSPFVRTLGLAFIIGGGTLVSAGVLTFYVDRNQKYQTGYHSPDWVVPVEIAGLIGFGVAAVGVVMFVTTGPSAKVLPARAATAKRPSRFALTPSVGQTGGGFRASWAF